MLDHERLRRPAAVSADEQRSSADLELRPHASSCGRPRQAVSPRRLEAAGPSVGRSRHLPVRPHHAPATRSTRSTRRRRRSAARCTWATSSATPTPTRSPATSACAAGRSSTRWAGTTTASPTERRVQNYYGVACDPSLPYDPDFEPPAEPPTQAPDPDLAAELRRAVHAADGRATRRRSSALWRRSGLSVDWTLTYTTIGDRSAAGVASAAFLRNLARGEAYQAEAPTLWDVDFRTAVAQAELEDREMPGAYHRIALPRGPTARPCHRHDPARAARGVRRAGRASRRRALPAAVRHRRCAPRCSASRCRCVAHQLADPEKGIGHRHDLHVRRHHRRHVVARAPACRSRSIVGRRRSAGRRCSAGASPRVTDGRLRRAGRQDGQAGAEAHRRAARRVGRARRRAAPDHAPGEVLRERRPPARDRHQPPVVHPQRWTRPRPA